MNAKQSKRILFVLNSPGGGATQGIIELLQAMDRKQYQAYLVVPHSPDRYQKAIFTKLAKQTFVVPMTWWNRKTEIPLFWRMLVWGRNVFRIMGHIRPVLTLSQLIRTYKISLVYTNTSLILDGALAARVCGLPHIWHIKEWIGRHARVKFWLPDPLLTRFISGSSDRVVVMTRFIGEIFNRYGFEKKVSLIYDGVDLQRYNGDLNGKALRQHLGVGERQLLVGMAASLASTWKQHDIFIHIAAQLACRFAQLRFVVFGPEPKPHKNPAYNQSWLYFQGLKKRVYEFGLEDRFIWGGFHSNIPQMMDALDILVHPCDQEPFGRVVIEAMAAKRPVVGPDRGGVAESIVNEETGFLVPAGNIQAFTLAVSRLIENPDLRRHMGENGRVRAEGFFSIKRHIMQVSEVLDTILN